MVTRKSHPKIFFSEEEKKRILRVIREAEKKTSGEIRVFMERKTREEATARARKVFKKIGMTKTKKRNGVLIYFSLATHDFAILGDQGIHHKVGEAFWQKIVADCTRYFYRDDFAGGLEVAIREIGTELARHFPREAGDANELPDEI